MTQDEEKRAAALYAAGLVHDGMVVGLGSGTTAEMMVEALGRRLREGLKFVGVATSKQTGELAKSLDIPLKRLDELTMLDLAIDGADEVDPDLNLIKGHGGQLMWEKLVAAAAKQFVVVADESKLVKRLGEHAPVPVEVVAFGWTTTNHRLERLGLETELRGGDQPFTTSNHNYILDCRTVDSARLIDQRLAREIKLQTGVVDHGLFFGVATMAVVGRHSGEVQVLRKQRE